jgi:hypothetical protein
MAQENKVIFTEEQVSELNRYQEERQFHPYTCCSGGENTPNCQRRSGKNEGILIATTEGWVCPCGEYKQYWAHDINK